MKMKQMYKNLKAIVPVVLVSVLVLLGAFAVVNAQGQDDGANPAKELLFDAQVYASNMNVSVDEAILRFQLQDIAGDLDAELTTNETETFAGLWIEHTPEFRVVVQFTRDGEETMKPYLKKYPEFADIVEVRNTAKVSLADLQRAQVDASYSVSASDIPVESDINVFNNSVELYVAKANKSQFDNALQRGNIRLPDKVKVRVITVDAMMNLEANIYGGLPLSTCTSGFSVKEGITKGITTAGHCSNIQSYNGNNLPFQSQNWAGSYDIQWHTAPGYTVTNKIQWWSDGSTRDITATKSRSSQAIGNYVCKYGMTSHYTCGYISSKNFMHQGQATYIRVDNTAGYDDLSSGGDSGGPWFLSNTAYGTHVGSPGDDPNDAVYMAVNYVESGLGVSVMTSP
ncbi:MAG: hypothetical protein KAU16_01035 [Methanophagales archaeon]|nr:hypothetical protein [Methanophagales archaeon]